MAAQLLSAGGGQGVACRYQDRVGMVTLSAKRAQPGQAIPE